MKTSRIIFILSLSLVAASCSKDKEVTFKSNGVTQTFAEGREAVPKGFPLPVYPGSATTGSVSAEGEGDEQTKFLMLTSTDPLEKISEFYQDELRNAGWSLDKVEPTPKLISISASRKELEANIMIEDDGGGKSTISLTVNHSGQTTKEDEEAPENSKPDKTNPPTD